MMKTLILVRHAKSSWAEAGTPDFDRPLNERGKRDAPEMARRLGQRAIKIDLLVSSPALRALATARYFADAIGFPQTSLLLMPELYHPTASSLTHAVTQLPDTAKGVLLFSHNPGITEFANSLTPVQLDHVPTCAVFAVAFDSPHWKDLLHAERRFLFFDYPKSTA